VQQPDVIPGARVRLRPVAARDIGRLVEILAADGVVEWWGPYDEDRAERELLDGDWFAVEHEGDLIGLVGCSEEDDPQFRSAGIDVTLHPAWHGRGLGADTVRALARWLIEERGHHRLTIDPAADNARAIRSYERVGFKPVGVMRRYERLPDGGYRDGLLMDLLADELR
jgi:aminoglycoside 6'-N-acetyltransferase